MSEQKENATADSIQEKPTSAFCAELERSPVTVANNNSSELKHALDDAIRRILVLDYKFDEIHTNTDRRLLLGYAAVAFAAYGSAYSYFVPFSDCKLVLSVCVLAYFLLNGAMMLYATHVEQDIVFQGVRKDPLGLEPERRIIVRTKHKRYTAQYTIIIETQDATSNKQRSRPIGHTRKPTNNVTLSKGFGDYFDVEGTLAATVLLRDISRIVDSYGIKLE